MFGCFGSFLVVLFQLLVVPLLQGSIESCEKKEIFFSFASRFDANTLLTKFF